VNGKSYPINVSSTDMPLLWALRDLVGLTGTKYGCGLEICGACTVLINGQPEKSCDMSVSEAAGKQIMTVEGLAADPDGKKAQAAWIANHNLLDSPPWRVSSFGLYSSWRSSEGSRYDLEREYRLV
jgi:isoquinoline 1-oxidoreductase alpha subunit